VIVQAPNTFRLTGIVTESGLPVQDATVRVTAGTGADLSTMTDYVGQYKLYGVAGQVTLSVTKAGYVDLVKTTTVAQNGVLDFPDAHQVSIPSLAGAYTLTLTADPGCSNQYLSGIPPLANELRQPHDYAATVTQDGPVLRVMLSGADFVFTNSFSGQVEPDGVQFRLGNLYYYNPSDGIGERLASGNFFVFLGFVRAGRSGVLSGQMNGVFEVVLAIRTLCRRGDLECYGSSRDA
jgi:hypothetical protein